MKVLRVIKIVKEIRFEVVWDELVAKSSKLILVSFRNSALQEEFKFCFSEFLLVLTKFSFRWLDQHYAIILCFET